MSGRPSFPARLPAGSPAAAPAGAPPRPPAAAASARSPAGVGFDSRAIRTHMVRKIAAQGVDAPVVLKALESVERHLFVDSGLVAQAYEDTSLPIGLGQTISKPGVVARMCALLAAAPGARDGQLGRVLEIGTGCGYQAAVLAHFAREVYSIERIRALHERARTNLRPFRIANIHLLFGDGMQGYAEGGPYAGIIAAAGGNPLPAAWYDQLAVGGRIVAPVTVGPDRQVLMVVDRTSRGFQESVLEDVRFVPLKSGIV